jgi:hypothetical protein
LLAVTADLEYRLSSLAECVDGLQDEVGGILHDAGEAMARADKVIKDTAQASPADRYTAAKQAKDEARKALKDSRNK